MLEQKERNIKKSEIMWSTHGYVIPAKTNDRNNTTNDGQNQGKEKKNKW